MHQYVFKLLTLSQLINQVIKTTLYTSKLLGKLATDASLNSDQQNAPLENPYELALIQLKIDSSLLRSTNFDQDTQKNVQHNINQAELFMGRVNEFFSTVKNPTRRTRKTLKGKKSKKNKVYICDYCLKGYDNKSNVVRHMKAKHTEEYEAACKENKK